MQAYDIRPRFELRAGAERLLQDTPGLLPLLDETCAELQRAFGPPASLALERFDDQESPDSPPVLFVRVRTTLDPEAAIARLQEFDERFWIDNVARGRGKLEVALEFG